MNIYKIFFTFFIINFGALAIGGLFTGPGVASDWFNSLHQAPWNPPGWVFGIAWTIIMICFTFYMTTLFSSVINRSKLLLLFGIQWLLNVGWSIAFFHFQAPIIALMIISALTINLISLLLFYTNHSRLSFFFLLPYLVWIIIATSLNFYIALNNIS